MVDDVALLDSWRTGDRAAGDALIRRYYENVRRFFDVKTPVQSEDLTQRTFLVAVAHPDRFQGTSSFKSYLLGIARLTLFEHLRDKSRIAKIRHFSEVQAPVTVVTPSGLITMRDEQRLLLRAMDSLTEDYRIALHLHYWEGMRAREIGEVMGIPTSTVTTRISRARNEVRSVVSHLRAKAPVKRALIADLDGWARSMVAGSEPSMA